MLTTWSVSGPNLARLASGSAAGRASGKPPAFGATLHVSGDDKAALEAAIAPFRTKDYQWRPIESGLEDVFIHLMDQSHGGGSP